MRRPVSDGMLSLPSYRRAGSTDKRRPAMKKISTATAQQSRNFCQPKLTIGLDLGDRSSWYCVLEERGEVVLEQRLGTTPKAMKEVLAVVFVLRLGKLIGGTIVNRVLQDLMHDVECQFRGV